MIVADAFRDRRVAVVGLGRSGLSAARSLAAGGATVLAWDDDEDSRERAAAEGIPLADPVAEGFDDIAALVLSPGIPHSFPAPHAAARLAREHDCPILCDIELLGLARPRAHYLGITGTNGKSTVTALLGHILGAAGIARCTGGNLGPPVLEFDDPGADGWFVLEMSSYQLERTFSIAFAVAVLVNISADHLDRHGGMEGYIAAKERIFAGQGPTHTAVVGIDDAHSRAVLEGLRATGGGRIVPVSAGHHAPGGVALDDDGRLRDETGPEPVSAAGLDAIATLPGRHNRQNIAAAWAAARAVGIAPDIIGRALHDYPGLPHRQQRVASTGDIAWINDSKATNPEAAARALACYDSIWWIAGGRAKDATLAPVLPFLDRVRHAILIGEAAPAFAEALDGRVPVTVAGDLAAAVDLARREARGPDAVVLLSPACASFDQFASFEARGEAFRKLVTELREPTA